MIRKILLLLLIPIILCGSTFYSWRYREHATDCTSLTDGRTRDLCFEIDDEALYKCVPSVSGGVCDTAGEWKSASGIDLASPGEIGGTTPAAATFTTVEGSLGSGTPAAIIGTTIKANTSLELAAGAIVTEIENNDVLGTSDTKLCTQGNVKAYVDATGSDIELVSVTTFTTATNSGDIAISQGVSYMVKFILENTATTARAYTMRFNSDSGANYSNSGTSFSTTPDTSITLFSTVSNALAGGIGHLVMSTINTDQMMVQGEATAALTGTDLGTATICGYWDASTEVTSFEFICSLNCTGKVLLYKLNES